MRGQEREELGGGPFSSHSAAVSAEVELTVQTFAQKEEGRAVHVKVVAAARAAGQGGDEGEGEGEEEPEADNAEGDFHGMTKHQSQLQHRQIDEDRSPQVPAPATNKSKSMRQFGGGWLQVLRP